MTAIQFTGKEFSVLTEFASSFENYRSSLASIARQATEDLEAVEAGRTPWGISPSQLVGVAEAKAKYETQANWARMLLGERFVEGFEAIKSGNVWSLAVNVVAD